MDAEGKLDLYPEASAKGYFDIDFAEGRLVLKSRGFVGLIPLSDRVAIHVLPRAPIGSTYSIGRLGAAGCVLEVSSAIIPAFGRRVPKGLFAPRRINSRRTGRTGGRGRSTRA